MKICKDVHAKCIKDDLFKCAETPYTLALTPSNYDHRLEECRANGFDISGQDPNSDPARRIKEQDLPAVKRLGACYPMHIWHITKLVNGKCPNDDAAEAMTELCKKNKGCQPLACASAEQVKDLADANKIVDYSTIEQSGFDPDCSCNNLDASYN